MGGLHQLTMPGVLSALPGVILSYRSCVVLRVYLAQLRQLECTQRWRFAPVGLPDHRCNPGQRVCYSR
jgi:hypothetical protein